MINIRLFKCTELSRSKKKNILKDQGIKYPKNIKLGWGGVLANSYVTC